MNEKVEIKKRFAETVLFKYEKENNTLRDTVIEAVSQGADLAGAYLEGAYLEGANLRWANLRGANLVGARLVGADLEGTDLEEADLEGVDLKGADLAGTNLRGANLVGANLVGANLRGANLRRANLVGANLVGAYIYFSDKHIDVDKEINSFEEKTNIKITESYINKNVIPTRWNWFWKHGLIICKWEEKPGELKKMTVKEICEKLGYDVEIVKEHDDE